MNTLSKLHICSFFSPSLNSLLEFCCCSVELLCVLHGLVDNIHPGLRLEDVIRLLAEFPSGSVQLSRVILKLLQFTHDELP